MINNKFQNKQNMRFALVALVASLASATQADADDTVAVALRQVRQGVEEAQVEAVKV